MRRGFYFVLMVVLVLRGLTGTAMAAGVLPPLQPAEAQHMQAHSHLAAMESADATVPIHRLDLAAQAHNGNGTPDHPPPLAIQATAAAEPACDGHPPECDAHSHHSATCSACEICHSAMLSATAPKACAHSSRGAELPTASARFDSAPAALSFKPPIA